MAIQNKQKNLQNNKKNWKVNKKKHVKQSNA